jgi:hypothetical protein
MKFNRFIFPFTIGLLILLFQPTSEFIFIVILVLFAFTSFEYSRMVELLKRERFKSVTTLQQELKKIIKDGNISRRKIFITCRKNA